MKVSTVADAEKFLEETNPAFKEAKKRAEEMAKTFQLNEVIEMLDGLIAEVGSMHIAKRFSPDKTIFSSYATPQDLNPQLRNMTESEYKKWQMINDLTGLKTAILGLSGKFRDMVIDIEAAKID